MEANELRVGNYVSYIGNETRVTVISDGFVSTLKSAPLTYNQVAPMPLTKEWLLKFGFEKQLNKTSIFYLGRLVIWIDYNGCVAYLKDESRNENIYIPNPVKHVHQLQNLYFALTGEELTLILK